MNQSRSTQQQRSKQTAKHSPQFHDPSPPERTTTRRRRKTTPTEKRSKHWFTTPSPNTGRRNMTAPQQQVQVNRLCRTTRNNRLCRATKQEQDKALDLMKRVQTTTHCNAPVSPFFSNHQDRVDSKNALLGSRGQPPPGP